MPTSAPKSVQHRVLVLGAYGLIGSAIARRLRDDGFVVVGLGRNAHTAQSVLPDIEWLIYDLGDLCTENAWDPLLADIETVVNCAGALQQSARDDLDVVHHQAVKELVRTCKTTGTGLVQISAVGAHAEASTPFMRTKASGDALVRDAGINHWIFRPGMILAPTAYGGSTLLRMLAAFPLVQPLACPDVVMQTLSLSDLANAVAMAVRGEIPAGTECDLVEDTGHSLRDVVAANRRWLGFAPARYEIVMPRFVLSLTSGVADVLGLLGWRSPLRSSAVQVLTEGVVGDPEQWTELGGPHLSSMDETLNAMPATVEDRSFARMALMMPFAIATLFVFWLVSGIVGFFQIGKAAMVLENIGWSHGMATTSVAFWSLVDTAIALALLVRKHAAWSCWAMVAVSMIYLASATFTVPQLWSDPLGPLVKILPAIMLALVARAMLETR